MPPCCTVVLLHYNLFVPAKSLIGLEGSTVICAYMSWYVSLKRISAIIYPVLSIALYHLKTFSHISDVMSSQLLNHIHALAACSPTPTRHRVPTRPTQRRRRIRLLELHSRAPASIPTSTWPCMPTRPTRRRQMLWRTAHCNTQKLRGPDCVRRQLRPAEKGDSAAV